LNFKKSEVSCLTSDLNPQLPSADGGHLFISGGLPTAVTTTGRPCGSAPVPA
jgi:hypothetical protein